MKKTCLYVAFLAVFVFLGVHAAVAKNIDSDCTYNGIKLYGKVKIVTSFPDIKVQKVNAFQNLSVQMVDVFPDVCGKWQIVDTFSDFTVQFVNAFPDITIKEVTAFPGIN